MSRIKMVNCTNYQQNQLTVRLDKEYSKIRNTVK
ncbi:hypothetical protein ATK78_0767 [Pedobacter metabolipauper]|uniref:Uncharacterized protein n=1 Tax=Pedobacter metabolipauper TaxID=425513 RepID=A0A4R6SYI8_9SPHI|nr:hypothetical protein ATK78_0767 [Pedobacter metabolipauper]